MNCIATFAALMALVLNQGREPQPSIGKLTPPFSLPDSKGKVHGLQEFRGSNLVLFFYCGCAPCHECAKLWIQMVRSGGISGVPNRTAAVFTGDASEAHKFTESVGWDATFPLMLDPHLKVARSYDAETCPRVFVLDSKGSLRYTNSKKGTRPGEANAATILSGVVTVLRDLDTKRHQSPVKPVQPRKPIQ